MGQEYKGEHAYEPDSAQTAVEDMVAAALRPLAKIMLAHRMPVQTLEAIAQSVFVEVAEQEFALPGRKQSTSRIALLTGLTRKAVKFLRETGFDGGSGGSTSTRRWNRAYSVINGWATDPMFKTDGGEPRELKVRGSGLSFETLVKRYGGDMPVVTVLNELKASDNVEVINGETVRLLKRHHSPEVGSESALHSAGMAVERLGETLEYNVMSDEGDVLFPQHEYWSAAVPEEKLAEFRMGLTKLLREVGDSAMNFLDEKEQLPKRNDHWTSGIGYYYFQKPPENSG